MILTGRVVARDALRHTPAGIPALDLRLEHESTQREGQIPRSVKATVDAVVIGELARSMDALAPGDCVTVTGFLANRSRRSTRVILHINEFEPE
ncbi:MAG: primosomal replication protein N [Burkholderiales bacterium]|nr:primosomal replication protein N [Burkholderiales bacterium]